MDRASIKANGSIQRIIHFMEKPCKFTCFIVKQKDAEGTHVVNIGKFLPRHPANAKFWLGILKWFRGFFLLHQLQKKYPRGFSRPGIIQGQCLRRKKERKVQEVSFPLCSWDILLWRRVVATQQ